MLHYRTLKNTALPFAFRLKNERRLLDLTTESTLNQRLLFRLTIHNNATQRASCNAASLIFQRAPRVSQGALGSCDVLDATRRVALHLSLRFPNDSRPTQMHLQPLDLFSLYYRCSRPHIMRRHLVSTIQTSF